MNGTQQPLRFRGHREFQRRGEAEYEPQQPSRTNCEITALRFQVFHIDAEDRQPFFWSAGWFATVLSAYYIVRPVREALGSMEGATRLKYFFLAVFLTMLIAVPLYAFLVSRFERRRLVPIVYRFLALNLVAFSVVMRASDQVVSTYVAPVFFVWVSVYVMFLTSLFWSVQADVFSKQRGKKLFGRISGCGTVAAILSSLTMGEMAEDIGPANMLLVSAFLMECGLQCFRRLDPSNRLGTQTVSSDLQSSNPFTGFVQVIQIPYLRTILLYTFVTTLCSTCLYTQQAEMLKAAWPDAAERTGVFARLDFWTLVCSAVLQFVVATMLIKRSVGSALLMLPLVYAVGFGGLSATSSLWVLMGTVVLSRACMYGLSVPAIGVLYTVVGREEKYKAKSVIDTVVIRGSDALTAWSVSGLRAAGLAIPVLTGLMVPIACICMGLGLLLGRRNAQAKSVAAS